MERALLTSWGMANQRLLPMISEPLAVVKLEEMTLIPVVGMVGKLIPYVCEHFIDI